MAACALSNVKSGGVMVVSASSLWREQNIQALRQSHAPVEGAVGGADALSKLEAGGWGTLLLDRTLPDLEHDEFVQIVRRKFAEVEIIELDAATGWPADDPDTGLNKTAAPSPMRRDFSPQSEEQAAPSRRIMPPLPGMIGTSEPMMQLYRLARLVAPRLTTVLIAGPTGSGKELVARALHKLSPRASRPFAVINCAAIPESLLESELFGYVRGAFTGAVQSQIGRVHAAQGGTLFLDEVGELPLSLQSKLLRFLELKEIQRLGSPEVFRVDVRVVAATNSDLGQRVLSREFRKDLYYRLSAFPLELPPLAERGGDILPLARFFIASLAASTHCPTPNLDSRAIRLLERHSWPGNVRELQQVLERASILAEGGPEILPEHISFPNILPERPPLQLRKSAGA
jgi:transcriptional regulator with GAF, ATPase, and Fis domain